MLPNHAPLVVAEQFAMLEALHPGRIDLGIGRAPGTDPATAAALRRSPDAFGAEDFPRDLLDLMGLLGDERVEHGAWSRFRATPVAASRPQIVLLGSSGYSAQLAGQLGLGFGFAHHFDMPGVMEAVALYRDSFRPSPELDEPYTIVTAGALAADDAEHAEYLAGPARLAVLGIRTGRRMAMLPPDEAAVHPDIDVARSMPSNRIVGDGPNGRRRPARARRAHPGRRADGLDDDARAAGADPHPRADRRALADGVSEPGAVVPSTDLAAELALALELADVADAITLPPFAARTVTYDWKANDTEVTALDRGAEAGDRRPHRSRSSGPPLPRRGARHRRRCRVAVAVDRRPDRRHVRLRPRHPGLGDAHRPRPRRRRRRGRRLGAGAGPTVVGVERRRHVRRRSSVPRVRRRRRRRRPGQHHASTTGGTTSA